MDWKIVPTFGFWTKFLLCFRQMHVVIQDGIVCSYKVRKNLIYLYDFGKIKDGK